MQHAWSELPISESIADIVRGLGFQNPTAIQQAAISAAINDRCDVLGAAPTGSGKTLAFGIPVIESILLQKRKKNIPRLLALVLVPTRELAVQVKQHLTPVAEKVNVSVASVIGGLSMQKQERVLSKVRPDIVVATPGRLWELISEGTCKHVTAKSIKRVKLVVVDEADRMTEKGHFEEMTPIIELLQESIVRRQIFVFSATLTFVHKPTERQMKAKKMTPRQKIRFLVKMLGMREKNTKVIDLTDKGVGTPSDQLLTATKINCTSSEKDMYLYYLLAVHSGRTLVFCNSKDCLRRLVNVLKQLEVNPLSLHASMEQKRRLQNLEKFTANPRGVLIASDVAARGLDIANIDHVVHYQVPMTVEGYIHRSGRTARATNRGLTLILCSPQENYYYRRLCQAVNQGNDLTTFPIDESVMKVIRNRVNLAQEVDKLEHSSRKNKAEDNWFKKAAKELDVEYDERPTSSEEANNCKRLKVMQKSLKAALKQPLIPRNYFSSYLTKEGAFKLPCIKGQKAIDSVADVNEDVKAVCDRSVKRRKRANKKNNKFKKRQINKS